MKPRMVEKMVGIASSQLWLAYRIISARPYLSLHIPDGHYDPVPSTFPRSRSNRAEYISEGRPGRVKHALHHISGNIYSLRTIQRANPKRH